MDIGYLLFNTIIYGCCALVLSGFFSYGNILNFSLGSTMMMSGYLLFFLIKHGFTAVNLAMLVVLLISFFGINYLLFHCFESDKKREHAGLIITLGVSLFLENLTNYVYGSTAVSLPTGKIPLWMLVLGFLVLLGLLFFFHKKTFQGKLFQAISENGNLIRALGIKRAKVVQLFFAFFFVLIVLMSWVLLYHSSMRMQDGLFYMIKGMGIMILVGLARKEYLFLGALLYVLAEYLLFVNLGLPIAYKESLILIVIVLVLLIKPQGLFSLRKRSL